MRHWGILFLSAGFLALSCAEPSSREYFVKVSGTDQSGRYAFTLDMGDTLAAYSIYFFTRIDREDFPASGDIAVDISFVSPSGIVYGERVYLPEAAFSSGDGYANDCDVPYRTGFRPSECGIWNMYIAFPDEERHEGLRGMGVRLSKDKSE